MALGLCCRQYGWSITGSYGQEVLQAQACGEEMSEVTNNTGKDPMVFLTNGTRIALKLEGPSDRPQSVVQAAQEAYFAEFGEWPYVQGMPNEATTPDPEPEPEPEPEAIKKSKPRR